VKDPVCHPFPGSCSRLCGL